MSLYHGMLLFDVAEKPINGWEENLGTRGMFEEWRKDHRRIEIDIYDEAEEPAEWEAAYYNDQTGYWESLMFGTFEQCKRASVKFMKHN